jgi:hypothetical protein
MENNIEQIVISQIVAQEKLRDKSREQIALGHPAATQRGLLRKLIRIITG